MRREPNAATEEALAKSRGNRAHRSWKVKQANAALARDREEEEYETSRETSSEDPNMYDFPSSPTSHHETPSVQNATMSENLTPIPEHNGPRESKRKLKARLDDAKKRRKLAAEPNSSEGGISTAEEMTVGPPRPVRDPIKVTPDQHP